MSELAEVGESDHTSQGFADVNDQPRAAPSWEPYVTALFAILMVALTAGWGAFLVWGAAWFIGR